MLKDLFTQELIDTAVGRLPPDKRKPRPKTIDVFKNPILEKYLARAHWVTPGLWFLPIAAWGLYTGFTNPLLSTLTVVGLFFGGWLFWSLLEYVLHRFLFHSLTPTDEHPENYLVHSYHHDFPDDATRLVMVPIGSWPLGVIFATVFRLALGPTFWFPAFAGACVGYVAYDWVHYYTHHAKPTSGIGRWMRMYHLQHHFDHSPARYGVSSPLWDIVFGTYKPAKAGVSGDSGESEA
jgi:sterol desaturase/sphingolipid hydroxylase (fatty acid hydroxylase superfamily)